ncbi:MAG: hypothetical protein FIA91_04210 [Geobacter sp.]|nr:hypothetical protein [Geobacter sp.]
MNSFGELISKRRYLLPLLAVVSFFFFSQGIVLPHLVSPQDARLSKPEEVKPLSCIIGKAQLKSSQCRILKVVPFVALYHKVEITSQQPSCRTVSNQQFQTVGQATGSSASARAPPA